MKKTYTLKSKLEEANNVMTLEFESDDKQNVFPFRAGQFVLVELMDSPLCKEYTISSAPHENSLAFTLKKIGPFSEKLCNLKVGDKAKIMGPIGFFYPKNNSDEIIFLAGGIGITPFWSLIKDCMHRGLKKNIYLFYSNQTKNDIAFFEELNKLSCKADNINVVYFLTREKADNPKIKEFGRINAENLKKYLTDFANKDYFICGSVDFIRGMFNELEKAGVTRNRIFVEAFY